MYLFTILLPCKAVFNVLPEGLAKGVSRHRFISGLYSGILPNVKFSITLIIFILPVCWLLAFHLWHAAVEFLCSELQFKVWVLVTNCTGTPSRFMEASQDRHWLSVTWTGLNFSPQIPLQTLQTHRTQLFFPDTFSMHSFFVWQGGKKSSNCWQVWKSSASNSICAHSESPVVWNWKL